MRTILGRFLRPGALALLLGVVPLAPTWAQMVLHMPTAAQSAAPQQQALSLAVGESLRLENLSLDDRSRSTATAELRRIAVTDNQTRFTVHTGDQTRDIEPPVRAYFSGQLAGEPGSSVFVSIDGDGAMRSIVDRGAEVFVNEVVPGSAKRPALALSRRIDQESDFAGRTFACGVTPRFIEENRTPALNALRQQLRGAVPRATELPVGALSAQRRADIIIETDYELFQRLGGSTQTAAYVADLFAYINARYQSEVSTRLNLSQVNIYSTSADPWTSTSSSAQLNDLRAYWNAGSRAAQARHHVHMLSAKDGGGGIAYMDTLGFPSYGYGVSTGIEGSFSASNPQIVWDAVEIAHEIGHAFGSSHTHEFDNPSLGSPQGGAIDCCYSDSAGSQCAVNNGGAGRKGPFPGIGSITGGVAGQRTGTIMSYCHTISPGMANVSFNFGTNHPYGVNPERVADVLRTASQDYLPLDTQTPVSYTLSVMPSGTGSGSVVSSPSGIQCGSDCSEAYTVGTVVTLTATAVTGSTFGGWSGSCSGAASTCNVSMDSARSVGAVFTLAPTSRLVTVIKSGSGSGSISSTPAGLSCAAVGCSTASASFSSTTAITLTAAPATGSTFGGWSGACSGTYSTCSLVAGTSTLNVTATFNASSGGGGGPLSDPTLFVSQQYYDLFNRSPDAAGLSQWVARLNAGYISRAALIETFMAQPEFKDRYGPLVRLYTAYFKRVPDYVGLMYWYGQMYPGNGSSGMPLNRVSDMFAQSPEFIKTYGSLNNLQFVELVYQNVLGRAAEPVGREYWVGSLNAGLIRGEMMIGFSESIENTRISKNDNSITMAFASMLRRVPSASERSAWLAAMNGGSESTLTLIQAILDSPAYASRFP